MVNFSPLSFLADPLMWLRAVSKYRAIWTASPDFGYRLCTKRAGDADVSDIDLSCLVYCVGGVGQRCVPSLLREFAAYFAIHARLPDDGNRGIFVPNYGLAEHVVATCGENDGLVASRRRPDLISCGSDFPVDVCVVDATTRRVVTDGTPGELWLSSGSVAQGYWGKSKLSTETFGARVEPDDGKAYLRTGDEAFIEDGRLFVCGRIKDMVIIGGENYYSDDIEVAAAEAMADSARPGCIAAFAVASAEDENERLCVVLEVRDHAASECEALASTLKTRVGEAVGLRPRRVVFIKQKTILKTTSGKLRRRAIRDALVARELRVVFDSDPTLGGEQEPLLLAAADGGRDVERNDSAAGVSQWLRRLVSSVSDSVDDYPQYSAHSRSEKVRRGDSVRTDPTMKWSESLLEKAQARGCPYELSDFLGVWEVLDEHYPFRRFRVEAENAIDDHQNVYCQHHLGCGRFPHEAAVVAKIKITLDDVDLRPGVSERAVAALPRELYVLVLHTTGLVKFVPHSASSRHLLAPLESHDALDAEMNLKHAENFGCFRFGIVVGDGRDRRLIRLNRWATDNRYFWSAVSLTRDFTKGVIDEPRELIAAGLAAHPGVDGTTPSGALRDTILALHDESNPQDAKRATAARVRAAAAIAVPTADFPLAGVPASNRVVSVSGGLALVERVAKQIINLFPPDTILKDHPDLPVMLRQLAVTDALMRRLEYDDSVVDVAAFVEAIKSNVMKMPVLLQVAQELENRQPGCDLPISDERAAADLRRAVVYCFALHTLGISTLRPSTPPGDSDFLLDFLMVREGAINDRAIDDDINTSSPYELMKHEALLSAARIIAETRRKPSHLEDTARLVGELLADDIIVTAVEGVSNTRVGFELAYWSCVLQQPTACVVEVATSTLYAGTSESVVRYEVCPAMMSKEWVQIYIIWNLSFGLTELSPFLPRVANLLVPCLLSLTNEDPALFLWMRTTTLNMHATSLACHPELRQITAESYDWRSKETSTALGELIEKLVCQLSNSIAAAATTTLANTDKSQRAVDGGVKLATLFSNSWHRVLDRYQVLERSRHGPPTRDGKIGNAQSEVLTIPRAKDLVLSTLSSVVGSSDEISVTTNFFEAGVDSLALSKLTSSLSTKLGGVRIPLSAVFENPTVEALAQFLVKHVEVTTPTEMCEKSAVGLPDSVKIAESSSISTHHKPNDDDRDVAPGKLCFSWNQQQLLTEVASSQVSQGFGILAFAAWARGSISVLALRRALNELVRRHAILRTTYGIDDDDGHFTQCERDDRTEVVFIDAVAPTETEAVRRAKDEVLAPLDILRGDPVIRCLLVRVATGTKDVLLSVFVHHVACDGMSSRIMLREMRELYVVAAASGPDDAAAADIGACLPELKQTYGEFARRQRAMLDRGLEGEKRYWSQHLNEGDLEVLNLPVDRTRPAKLTYRGDHVDLRVPTGLASALARLAAEWECTLFHAFLAIWALLLGRHSGAEHVVVGTPSHGRSATTTTTDENNLCGFFVNVLPLNLRVPRGMSASSLVRNVRKVAIEALSNSRVPFQYVVENLLPKLVRDPSRNSVFQTLIMWEPVDGWHADATTNWTTNLSFEPILLQPVVSMATCDVTFTGRPTTSGHVEATIKFNADLFERTSIQRLADHFVVLASALVEDQHIADIWQLTMISDRERERLLTEFNTSRVDSRAQDTLIQDLVWDQGRRYPATAAVEWQRVQMTYSELEQRALTIAAALRTLGGVKAEMIVALLLRKSLGMATAIFGVLSSGGAFMPLDPRSPVERQRLMLEDARCKNLVTHEDTDTTELVSGIIDLTTTRLGSDGLPVGTTDAPPLPPEVVFIPRPSSSTDLCYVMYTSGSTGRPKGVMVEHRGVVNVLLSLRSFFRAPFPEALREEPDRLVVRAAVTAQYIFDGFLKVFLGTLVFLGGTCVLFPNGSSLFELRESDDIGLISEVPTILALAESLPSSIRALTVSGEILSRVAALNCLPRVILNVYGPTEVSIDSTLKVVSDADTKTLSSIGKPLANVLCYVVAPDTMELQPIGVFGELILGGIQVARGYLNRPELTSAKFVKNPWPETDASGRGVVYRTGDLVRWHPNGELEFACRIDNQVKLRGHRIELGEIEHVLREQVGVIEAVCVLRDDVGAEPQLVAYVNPAEVTKDALRSSLRQTLPAYLVPSIVVGIEVWPRTGSGKIDRKRLPVPATGRAPEHRPPSSPLELTVARVVAEAIGCRTLDDLDVETSLFEQGASSLSAVRIRFMLQKEFSGLEDLESTLVFDHESIRELAAVIEERIVVVPSTDADIVPEPVIAQVAKAAAAGDHHHHQGLVDALDHVSLASDGNVLSYNQLQWLTECASADVSMGVGIMPLAKWVRGTVSIVALRKALNDLVHRHAILRTTYGLDTDNHFTQTVHEHMEVNFVDAVAMTEADALQRARDEQSVPFDLLRGDPVVRCLCVCLLVEDSSSSSSSSSERTLRRDLLLLVVFVHHIACDGTSTRIVLRELRELYLSATCTTSAAAENGSCLPKPELQYFDFARTQRALLLSDDLLEKHKRYWSQHLREGALEPLNLPLDYPRSPRLTYSGDYVEVRVSTDLASALSALAAEFHCRLFHVFLAIWALLLGRHSGAEEVVVGTPSEGRTFPGFRRSYDNVCGYFVNVLPLNINVSRGLSAPQLVETCKRVVIDSLSSSHVPFQYVVNELLPKLTRDPTRNTVFQTLINWQPMDGWSSDSQTWTPALTLEKIQLPSPPPMATCDVMLTARPTAAGRVEAIIEFNAKLFERASIERLAERFLVLAAALVHDREIADIWQLPMIPDSERDRLLTEFNHQTCADHQVRDVLVNDLVWEQARRHPEITAVEWQGSQMTYSELEDAASTIGARLRALGVRSNVIVALLLHRSLAMATAILGVLSAGGAFMPLDTRAPAKRQRLTLEDARCSHLITREDADDSTELFSGIDLTELRLGSDGRVKSSGFLEVFTRSSADLCYIIYTSGSTGRPKGVMVEHCGVVNLLMRLRPFFESVFFPDAFRKDQRFVVRVALAFQYVFDFFYQNFFTTLIILGGTSVLLQSGSSLFELRESDNIALVSDVPSTLALADSLPSTVRVLVVGGEALTRNVASNSRLNRRHLLNVYGPTEVSIISTVNIVTDADTKTLSSIGKPLANVACYVVAPDTMELQPIGVFGELILGGIQVARGYLNRPDLTSAKFVKNPWPETDPSGRGVVYRTGDLVRWRPNGELEFAGRIDNQVKLRGHRIELGEIEHVLREQVGVIEAVCVLRDDVSADPQLVAYVNPAAADLDVEASLRPCLQQTLPAYLVPSIIVGIEVWPRTGSGKIDRKRLPVPVARRATGERRPPASPIETTVARIVANTIGCSLDDVDAETSLFELGANSLSAVRIRFKLQEEFPGVELEPTLLLDHKNVRELAAVLETKGIITAPSRDMSNAPLDDGTNSLDVVTVAEGTETREQRVLHYYSALRFACWVVAYSYVAAVFVVPAWLVAWRLNQSQVESWRLAILVHGPLAWASLCVLLSFAAAGTRLLLAPGAAAVSLESVKFIAWWTIERIDQMNRFLFLEELRRTPLLALYYRLLGAHIGSGVVLDTVHVREPRFVFIGAGCVLGPQVIVHPRKFDMVRRQVVFQTVELGASCRIEARAVLASGTKLASRTTVGPLATVTRETGNCGTNDGSSVSPEEPTTVWSTTCLSFVTSLVAIYATIVIIIASTYPAFVTLSLVLKKEGLYPPSNHKNVADALHSNPEAFATFTSTFVAAFSSKKKNSEACSYIVSPIFPSMSMIFSNTDPKVQRKLFLQRYGKTARLVPLVACVLVQHELAALAFGVASFWIARGIKTCLTRARRGLGGRRGGYVLPVWDAGQPASLEKALMFVYDKVADSIYRRTVIQFGATWVLRRYYTCLGAKIGSWTHVDFLLERITNLRQLRVGKNAHLGSFCTVFPTTGSTITIGDNSVVGFGSVILGTTDGSVHIPTTTLVGGNTLIRGGHAELREFSVAMNTEAMIAGAQEIEERTTEGYAIIARQGAVSFPWDRHGSRESLDYDHALTFWHKVLYVVAPFALLLWTRLLFGIALYGAVATATAAFEWLVYDVRNSDYGPDVHFRNSKPFLAVRAFAALAFLSSFLLGYACLAIVNKWFWFALDAQGRKTKQWMPFSVGYWMRQFGDAGRAGFTITSFFFVSSTAAYGWFVRMLGARVEGNAIVAAPVFWDVDNLVLKQNAVVEEGAIVFCHQYASDHVEVGTVTIGAGAVLEPGSLTTAGYELGAGSRLLPNKLGVPSKWAHESSIRGTHHHHHHHKRHY